MKMTCLRRLCAALCVLSAGAFAFAASTEFSPSDPATGWASYVGTKDLAGGDVVPPDAKLGTVGGAAATAENTFTVSDRDSFLSAVYASKKAPVIIYVEGVIDMTNGMLPKDGVSSTDALDSFIAKTSAAAAEKNKLSDEYVVKSYSEWKKLYASKVSSTADASGDIRTMQRALSETWGKQIRIDVYSDTTIIGKNGATIRGGTFQLSDAKNIVIRNLAVQDAFDPFPVQEEDDGLNAAWDTVQIKECKYVWIDHCSFQDTISTSDEQFDHVVTSNGVTEKWQTYDGLCDIKTASDFVTVSWCLFKNHDKTQLIGASKSATGDKNHLTITLHHNYYLNCRQRLPMVRYASIHIYNNVFDTDETAGRANQYAIGNREFCKIVSENNIFGAKIGRSVDNGQGEYYGAGNKDDSISKIPATKPLKNKPFDPSDYYKYSLDSVKVAEKNVKATWNK